MLVHSAFFGVNTWTPGPKVRVKGVVAALVAEPPPETLMVFLHTLVSDGTQFPPQYLFKVLGKKWKCWFIDKVHTDSFMLRCTPRQ